MRLAVLSALVLLAACGSETPSAPAPSEAAPVDVATATDVAAATESTGAMVVAAHPEATAAGVEILRQGGSAADAAVAVLSVLSLVEPQSAGLGGGAFMLHYDADTGALMVYDGRETAPMAADEALFLQDDGTAYGFLQAKNSGLSIGVPGAVDMLALAHEDHGVLPWADLFAPGIALAETGFAVTPRLNSLLTRFGRFIPATEEDGPTDAYAYFMPDGEPLAVGATRDNPAYADALRIIAADPRALYEGPLAEAIVAQAALPPRAGLLSLEDMATYEARRREPLCTPYAEMLICGAPPPSSGGVLVGQIMAVLEASGGFAEGGAENPDNWARFAQAQLLAYADQDQYLADDAAVPVPSKGLLHPDYVVARAALVSLETPVTAAESGDAWAFEPGAAPGPMGEDATEDSPGTTHFVIRDGEGNVVSLTASVESIFGSVRIAGGMLLNNQLTDFSRTPRDADGKLAANAPGPGKRPRSSMSPTVVLDEEGDVLLATGSPGGRSIIAYTAKSLVGVLDWGLSPQEAIDLPNVVARDGLVRIETVRADESFIEAMRGYGFEVRESSGENSGLHMLLMHADGFLEAGVDPRREGVAAGP